MKIYSKINDTILLKGRRKHVPLLHFYVVIGDFCCCLFIFLFCTMSHKLNQLLCLCKLIYSLCIFSFNSLTLMQGFASDFPCRVSVL